MANVDGPYGFKPVRNLDGEAWNGQTETCVILGADTTDTFVGDIVTLSSSGSDATGMYPAVVQAGVDSVPCGVITSVHYDPDSLTSLYAVGADTSDRKVEVCMDPTVLMKAQHTGTSTATMVGLNGKLSVGSGNTTSGQSGMEFDTSTANTTSTLALQFMRHLNVEDNAIGANAQGIFRFNVHQYGSVGTTGI